MSADDPDDPRTRRFVTDQGVRVVERRAPDFAQAPQEAAQGDQAAQGSEDPPERVVARPPRNPREKRDAYIRRIITEHGPALLAILGRGGVNPASAEEMLQELYIVLDRWLEENEEPENDRAFLAKFAEHQRCNRSRRHRLPVHDAAEAEEAATSAPDPERALELARRESWLDARLAELPEVERRIWLLVDREELTHAKAAEKLGIPLGSISAPLLRARAKLEVLAREEALAAERGKRKKPGP